MYSAGREWRILEKQEDKILLISQRTIGNRRFEANSNDRANSEIRRYLSGEFYNSLSNDMQSKIVEHSTGDKIFLLSIDEARRYFSSDADRVALNLSGRACWWWLRSRDSGYASYVYYRGNILLNGYGVDEGSGGVRPALWLNL